MLRVSCKDIGVEGCEFKCQAAKVGKVEDLMLEHIRDAHPHMIAGLTFEQHKALETRIKTGIHALEEGAEPHEHDRRLTLRVACRDLGVTGCDFVAEGEKARHVEDKMFDHIRERHPDLIAGLDFKQYGELEHRVKAAIVHEAESSEARHAA